MFAIHRRPSWAIAERLATPEAAYLDRRSLLKAGGGVAFAGVSIAALKLPFFSTEGATQDPLQCRATDLSESQRELIISTPYFVPGDSVSAAIAGSARIGVKVTLIVPRRNDSGFVARASRAYYPKLIEAGVTIAEYNGGLLHSKVMTVDGKTAFIGSSNMDIRSFDLNFENDVLLRDGRLVADIRDRQLEYLAASTLVDPEYVRSWPLVRHIWLNAFSTFGPVL